MFSSLVHSRESAEHWCREIAGTRVHGTTRKVPRDVFEAIERPTMRAAPDALYDVQLYVDKAKVHPDHHIEVARSLYSVPTLYLRKHVRVRADRKLVKIYFGTELIKMHKRQPPGGRSTDPSDYPTGKSIYATRDVDALLAKAKDRGVHIGIYAERLLGGPALGEEPRPGAERKLGAKEEALLIATACAAAPPGERAGRSRSWPAGGAP